MALTIGNVGPVLLDIIGDVTPTYPAIAKGDMAILVVISTAVSSSGTPADPNVLKIPAGFTEMVGSPQDSGVTLSNIAVRLSLYWRVCNSDAPGLPTPTIAGTANERTAFIFTIKGGGNHAPNITATGVNTTSSPSSSSTSINGGTTTLANTLVVCVVGQGDIGPDGFSSFTNLNLTSTSLVVSSGGSGQAGYAVGVGNYAGPGAYGASSFGQTGSGAVQAVMSFAIDSQNQFSAALVESISILEQASVPTTPALFSMIGTAGRPNGFGMFGVSGFAKGIASMGITVPVSETGSLAESIAALYSAIIAASDTITISEAIAVLMACTQSLSETVSIAEAVAAVYGAIIAQSDTVSVAESLAAVYAAHVAASESLTDGETLACVLACIQAVSETDSLSESIAALFKAVAGVSESISLAEAISALYNAVAGVSESEALAESIASAYAATVSVAETTSLAESMAAMLMAIVGASEGSSIAESIVATYQNNSSGVTLSEAIAIAETVDAVKGFAAGLSENWTIAELISVLWLIPHLDGLRAVLVGADTSQVLIAPQDGSVVIAETLAVTVVDQDAAVLLVTATGTVTFQGESVYNIVQFDLEPDMVLNVLMNAAPQPLGAATSIQMRWWKPDGTISLVSLTSVDLVNGVVKRVWLAGDTDQIGEHFGRVFVTWANAETETFPNDGTRFQWRVRPQTS